MTSVITYTVGLQIFLKKNSNNHSCSCAGYQNCCCLCNNDGGAYNKRGCLGDCDLYTDGVGFHNDGRGLNSDATTVNTMITVLLRDTVT